MNPTRIREYKIVAGPFSGTYGTVWIGLHDFLDLKRAFKCLHSHVMPDVMRQEALKMKQVKSPYVVQVFDFISDPLLGDLLVLEYCPLGLDAHLRDRFRQTGGKLPYDEGREILDGILKGLRDAHAAEIVHGDIKPANVRFGDPDQGLGFPKLADFGAARREHQTESVIRGSNNWMAPELLDGAEATYSSDYFSFGALAYLVLSGRHPFFADDPSCLTSEEDNIANPSFMPQSLSSLRDDINPVVADHVMVLLSHDPDLRTKSAEALVAALAQPWAPPSVITTVAPALPAAVPGLSTSQLALFSSAYEQARRSFFVAFDSRKAVATLTSMLAEPNWDALAGKRIDVIADAWSLLGYIKNSMQLYDEAVLAATNGLAVHPEHVRSLHLRGYALVHLSEYARAKHDLERALELTSDPRQRRQISGLLRTIHAREGN